MNRRSVPAKTLLLGLLGILAFILWQAVDLHRYNHIDTRPPSWDQSVHMEIAWDYLQALKAGNFSKIFFLPPKPGMPPFPPFYHLGLTLAYAFNNPAHAALWINWIFLVLLCVSIFGIAFHFRQDEMALPSAMMFACAPAIGYLLHTQLIDLSLVALAAAAYWALLKSNGFNRKGPSIAFAVIHAAGMLDKWSFFSYMLPAYVAGVQTLNEDRIRRRHFFQAAIISALLFMPWYVAHLPVLLPRLFQASADNAVAFWHGGALLAYFRDTAYGLGPPLWVLGWIGLMVPVVRRHREDVWLLVSWILTSYIFWTIVPNRQLRFLMPGLPAMAILALGAWPKALLWAVTAFQLFSAANFTRASVPTKVISFPLMPLNFFVSEPPAREDWRIPEMLDEVQRLRSTDAPFSNLTVVANDNYINGPTLNWEVKQLGLSDSIKIRGVNRRLCEFSEFVLLKRGYLGPPEVISGLPETAQLIEDKSRWFQRAYEVAATWPLPDRSTAVLFRQRRPKAPPFSATSFRFSSYSVTSAPFTAKNLKITLNGWEPRRSVYASVVTTADNIELRGLAVRGVKLELQDALVVPAGDQPATRPWEDMRFLKMKTLRVLSLRVTADDLKRFIESRAKGLQITQVEIDDGLEISARFHGIALTARATARLQRGQSIKRESHESVTPPEAPCLTLSLTRAKVGFLPLPVKLLGNYRRLSVPLYPNPETPFAIELAGLSLNHNVLTVP